MRKIIAVIAVFVLGLVAVSVISDRVDASRTIFRTGSADELEMAKRLSFDVLRSTAAADVDEFRVKRVEIDSLRMAHTHVQQIHQGVPVWEGEAIIHLMADGTLARMTDNLKGVGRGQYDTEF